MTWLVDRTQLCAVCTLLSAAILSGTSPVYADSCLEYLDAHQEIGVVHHTLAKDVLPLSIRQESDLMGHGYNGRGYDGHHLWARNYGPVRVGKRLISYLSPNFSFARYEHAASLKGQAIDRTNLLMTGGQVTVVGADSPGRPVFLLVAEKTLFENTRSLNQWRDYFRAAKADPKLASQWAENLSSEGYHPRSHDETLNELARVFRIPRENILVQPWMPGERTGDADVWSADLGNGSVIIPYIPPYLIDRLKSQDEQNFARATNGWLDARATDLRSRVTVERIPMFSPKNLYKSKISPLGYDGVIPSTVNWIKQKNKVFVPSFDNSYAFLGIDLLSRMKSEISEILKKFNIETEFVPADELLGCKGLLHCVTFDVPK